MSESHEHGITPPSENGGASQDISIPGGPGKPPLHFAPEEWEQFRKSDMGAAKAVVLLMGSIFTVGLLLYSTVAYICWFKVM
ncbi:MAG TPA: hypothetical protein VMG10_05305 [Gemmataceae bacterium]|nr:hypothetical protein [Gemmataceae bacterium]